MSKTKRFENKKARLKTRFQNDRRAWKKAHPIEAQEKRLALAVERERRGILKEERLAARIEKASAKAALRLAKIEQNAQREAEVVAAKAAIVKRRREAWRSMKSAPKPKKASLFSRIKSRLFKTGKAA